MHCGRIIIRKHGVMEYRKRSRACGCTASLVSIKVLTKLLTVIGGLLLIETLWQTLCLLVSLCGNGMPSVDPASERASDGTFLFYCIV